MYNLGHESAKEWFTKSTELGNSVRENILEYEYEDMEIFLAVTLTQKNFSTLQNLNLS